MHKILLVEDDENIRELVCYTLTAGGFSVTALEDGFSLFPCLDAGMPDLVLLDIMLPGQDGLSILRSLKNEARTRHLPVILLTAKGSELDRVKGLDSGADDYITKPFSVLELVARVKALLRRSQDGAPKPLCFAGIALDPERRTVSAHGKPVQLAYKEFELLAFLLHNRDLALSREQILRQVWGMDYEGESRTVDMHIMSLRQKLGASGDAIKTVRGVGYKIGESF